MVQIAPGPGTLELLQEASNHPFRPPTPPRSRTVDSPWGAVKESARIFPSSKTSLESTPEPPPEGTSQPSSSRRRVGFVEKVISKSEIHSILSPEKHAPSSAERKPAKSILKRSNGIILYESDSRLLAPHTHQDFASMLESICQQLAASDRGAKVDSYQSLCGAIKASEVVPDLGALKNKMGLLLQFIQRDLFAKGTNGLPDTALTNEALMTLASFLHNASVAELLHDDFALNLIEHAIKTFQDPGMSKEMVKKLMFVVAKQDFSPRIMTNERVTRLMRALAQIEEHISGKSITSQLLQIYRKLIRQSKACITANPQWLEYLFSCFQSDLHETRSNAIALGMDCATFLERDFKISSAVVELLEAEIQGHAYLELVSKNLRKFIKDPSKSDQVPQIWTVIVLFLGARPKQLEQWKYLHVLVQIIQDCFNCSDSKTKIQANIAWTRLVYAFRLDDKTSPKWIENLCNPLKRQLLRKDLRKPSYVRLRKATMGNLQNLIYYFLKPIPTHQRLDLFWDECISKLVGEALVPENLTISLADARVDMIDACLLLTGLLDSSTSKQWDERRALQDGLVEAKELPTLDPKWVRKSSSRLMPLMQRLIERMYGEFSSPSSPIHQLWTTYLKSIATASLKDIKTHIDTMSFFARLFEMLYCIWQKGPDGLKDSLGNTDEADFLSSFEAILSTTQQCLGVMPFTEREILMRNPGVFCAISTPSHRPRESYGEARTPLQHLVMLFTLPSLGFPCNTVGFTLTITNILARFLPERSRKERLADLKRLLQVLPSTCGEASIRVWRVLAHFAKVNLVIKDKSQDTGSSNEEPLGAEYRDYLLFLQKGIDMSPLCPVDGWDDVYTDIAICAVRDADVSGCALTVMEPLSQTLAVKLSSADSPFDVASLAYFNLIVERADYPKDPQALEAARKRLWGFSNNDKRSADPYIHLYAYICLCLRKAYSTFDEAEVASYVEMISAVHGLISRCPNALSIATLNALQDGMVLWIHDVDAKIKGGQSALKSAICSILSSHQQDSSRTLQMLETIILSGFQSRHKSIVNSTIEMWNQSFGTKQDLQYPEKLRDVLSRLRLDVSELLLPSFPYSAASEQPEVEFNEEMIDTQDELPPLPTGSSPSKLSLYLHNQRHPLTDDSPMSMRQKTKRMPHVLLPTAPSSSNKRTRDSTPEVRGKTKKRKKVQSTLKHNDSQVEFVPVTSSPLAQDPELLTDRQKEAKERQNRDAAIFRDVHVSPLLEDRNARERSQSMELPRPRSLSRSLPEASSKDERQATPDVPDQQDIDNFLLSSPTPANEPTKEDSEYLPPSSPPEQSRKMSTSPGSSRAYEVTSWLESSMEKEIGESEGPRKQDQGIPEGSPILGINKESSHAGLSYLPSTIEETIPPVEAREAAKEQPSEDMAEDLDAPDTPSQVSQQLLRETSHSEGRSLHEAGDAETDAMYTAMEVDEHGEAELPVASLQATEIIGTLPAQNPPSLMPARQSSPGNSELYTDAPAPPSSDLGTNDDVFVDAETSPYLSRPARKELSPKPEANLSGEEGLGEGMGSMVEGEGVVKSSHSAPENAGMDFTVDDIANMIVGDSMEVDADNNLVTKMQDRFEEPTIDPQQLTKSAHSSSNPSIIPETPGARSSGVQEVEIDGKRMYLVNGRLFDSEDTIIVDVPEDDPRLGKRKKSRKRKSDAMLDDKLFDSQASASQSSQLGASQGSAISKSRNSETPSSTKCGRGRPRRSSQRFENSQEADAVQEPSLLGVGDGVSQDDKDISMSDVQAVTPGVEGVIKEETKVIKATSSGEDRPDKPKQGTEQTKGAVSSGNIVEETTLPETSFSGPLPTSSGLSSQAASPGITGSTKSRVRLPHEKPSTPSKPKVSGVALATSTNESPTGASSPRPSSTASSGRKRLKTYSDRPSPGSRSASATATPAKRPETTTKGKENIAAQSPSSPIVGDRRNGKKVSKAPQAVHPPSSSKAATAQKLSSADTTDYGSTIPSLTPNKSKASAADNEVVQGVIPKVSSPTLNETPSKHNTRSTSQPGLNSFTSSTRSSPAPQQSSYRSAVGGTPAVTHLSTSAVPHQPSSAAPHTPTPAANPHTPPTPDINNAIIPQPEKSVDEIVEGLQQTYKLLQGAAIPVASLPRIQKVLDRIGLELPGAVGRGLRG